MRAFNKYTGKADKNQAFTPDHITNFMCRATGVDRTKRVFDGTCGSGSFLVQAMVLELVDCNRQRATEAQKQQMREKVAKEHIYGIEVEEIAYGLSTTNMLIHGDGNSNIKHASLFDSEEFFKQANPDIILMNAREVFGLTTRNRINKGFPGHTPLFLCPEIRAVRHRMAA